MAVTRRRMEGVTPRQVFDVLRDGFTYADWVVGTRTVRDVDTGWPAPGTRLHYTVGYFPLRKDDETVSRSCLPERELELEAQAWPAGTAHVRIVVEPDGDGTLVVLEEKPNRGAAKLLHNPVLDLLITARNVETLRRLEEKAAGRR